MKHFILAIALAFTAPAIATAQDKATEACTNAVQIAGIIMQNRQAGTSIAQMIELSGGNEAIIGLILIAYDTPRFSTQEYQQEAVKDFANEVGVACYKSMM